MDTEKSVGTLLREARLAKGLSIAEAEHGTSIRGRYLEALERDEYEKTPGEVFLKGMIRNYGNFLGLNGPELVQLYKASTTGMAKDAMRSSGIREVDKVKLNIQLKDPRDVGSGTGRFELPNLPHIDIKQCLVGVVVLLALVGGYFAIPKAVQYFQNRPQSVASPVKEKPAAEVPVAWDKVQVEMEATGDCWLEVQADGKEVFAGMVRAKDKKTFEAKEKLVVKYGNIGVMKIAFNGKSVDLQGEHGVAVKTYTLQGSQSESSYAKPNKSKASAGADTNVVTNNNDKQQISESKQSVPASAKVAESETKKAQPAAKTDTKDEKAK